MTISADLKNLFSLYPTKWASPDQTVTQSQGKYRVFVSDGMYGMHDMVRVHEALESADLIVKSKNPIVTDFGITTSEGHKTLGFFNRVKLSDNAEVVFEQPQGYSFEVSFENQNEGKVHEALLNAATFIQNKRDKTFIKAVLHDPKLGTLAKRDSAYEAIASELQASAGRTNAADEAVVVNYVKAQIRTLLPNGIVRVSVPEEAPLVRSDYGLKTKTRNLCIIVSDDDLTWWRGMSCGEGARFMESLNRALREKLPLMRPEFCGIEGLRRSSDGGTVLVGSLVGTSARLAAEISGELEAVISTASEQPRGHYGEPKKLENCQM